MNKTQTYIILYSSPDQYKSFIELSGESYGQVKSKFLNHFKTANILHIFNKKTDIIN